MIENHPSSIADQQLQAQRSLADADYAQAAILYQQLVEAEPEVTSHVWYLGLALLLQGQETEAQTTWMLAMVDGDADQIAQWSVELANVLRSQAEWQESRGQGNVAWALRQHIREILPDDLPNLLFLIQRSLELQVLDASSLSDLSLIPVLQAQAKGTVDPELLQTTLQGLLKTLPLQPIMLDMVDACLQQVMDPVALVPMLMHTAIDMMYTLRQPIAALDYATRCLEIIPDDLEILKHLSFFYQNANQHEAAIATSRRMWMTAQTLPDQVFAAFMLVRSLTRAGVYWNDIFLIFEFQEEQILQLAATQQDPLPASMVLRLVTSTFFQPYLRDSLVRNRQIQNSIAQLCYKGIITYAQKQVEQYRQGLAARRHSRDANRPLRIGYLSYALKRHSVGWLSRWLFQYHDRDRFQIYGYFWDYQILPDDLQQWFLEHVDQAHTFARDGRAIADQIFADEIDILIDLDSITADVCCEVIAAKPAPIQVTWLGWDASGLPSVDYFIADPYVLPESAEAEYSEKIWRLPQTYIAVDGFEVGVPTLRREDLSIPSDAVIYMSGQSAYKRHPQTVRSQLQIIRAVPNSYLLIKGLTDNQSIQDYFTQMAIAEEVDPSRLRFLPDVTLEAEHRANLSIADVVLDTYPYNGATTTLETLWVGIPLVTRVGEHFSSRNSYTMLVNAGIEEGIAWTEEEYIEWGIRFGNNPELRQHVAWKLWRSRQTAPIWNAKKFTREMENAYENMWKSYMLS